MSMLLFRRNANLRKNGYHYPPQGPSMFLTFKQMFSIVPTWLKVVWGIGILLSVGFGGTLLYVAVHFITKFW